MKIPTKILTAAAQVCSNEDSRYYLNGVFIEQRAKGGVQAISTNGHFMFKWNGPTCTEFGEEWSTLIPLRGILAYKDKVKVAGEPAKTKNFPGLNKSIEEVELFQTESGLICVRQGEHVIKPLNENYPEWIRVFSPFNMKELWNSSSTYLSMACLDSIHRVAKELGLKSRKNENSYADPIHISKLNNQQFFVEFPQEKAMILCMGIRDASHLDGKTKEAKGYNWEARHPFTYPFGNIFFNEIVDKIHKSKRAIIEDGEKPSFEDFFALFEANTNEDGTWKITTETHNEDGKTVKKLNETETSPLSDPEEIDVGTQTIKDPATCEEIKDENEETDEDDWLS